MGDQFSPLSTLTWRGLRDFVRLKRYLARRPDVNEPDDVRRRYVTSTHFLPTVPLVDFLEVSSYWVNAAVGRKPSKVIGLEGSFETGKTEMALALAVSVCGDVWGERPRYARTDSEGTHRIIPVVHVIVTGDGGERKMIEDIMFGLGLPAPAKNDSPGQLLLDIAAQCRRSRTRLITLDDFHALGTGRGRLTTKFLKLMFERLPVTLLFIAPDLSTTPLHKPSTSDPDDQVAAQQLTKRTIKMRYGPVASNDAGLLEWIALIDMCVSAMPLRSPTELDDLDYAWLLKVCDGHRVPAMQVVLHAGGRAVGGEERVTRAGLERMSREMGLLK